MPFWKAHADLRVASTKDLDEIELARLLLLLEENLNDSTRLEAADGSQVSVRFHLWIDKQENE